MRITSSDNFAGGVACYLRELLTRYEAHLANLSRTGFVYVPGDVVTTRDHDKCSLQPDDLARATADLHAGCFTITLAFPGCELLVLERNPTGMLRVLVLETGFVGWIETERVRQIES